MGISPGELASITPYEFSLIREGYNRKQRKQNEQIRFQSYVTYASTLSAQGIEPASFEDWGRDKEEEEYTGPTRDGAIEIDAAEKARLEALMNSIR